MIGFSYATRDGRKDAWQNRRSEEFARRLAMDNASKCPVSGKRKYATEGAALATAKHQIATGDAPTELRAYLCNWCNAWHLTKKTGKTDGDR